MFHIVLLSLLLMPGHALAKPGAAKGKAGAVAAAKRLEKDVKIGAPVTEFFKKKPQWSSAGFFRGVGDRFVMCLQLSTDANGESFRVVRPDGTESSGPVAELAKTVEAAGADIAGCDKLRITVHADFPHRASFNVIFGKDGTVREKTGIEYWK